MILGKRTVPPKPGIRPNFTSGNPIAAVVSATRKSVARAISHPPPKAKPLIAETVGTGKSSKPSKTCEVLATQAKTSSSCILNNSVNSVMSAPTIKVDFAERTNTPLTCELDWILCVASASSVTV